MTPEAENTALRAKVAELRTQIAEIASETEGMRESAAVLRAEIANVHNETTVMRDEVGRMRAERQAMEGEIADIKVISEAQAFNDADLDRQVVQRLAHLGIVTGLEQRRVPRQ